MTPKYRTDARACSCPGFWYRRRCRHIIAYREAVALVQAQDVFNLTWDTAKGSNVAVRGSQGDSTIPANTADIGEKTKPDNLSAFGGSGQFTIGDNLSPMGGG